MELSQNQLKHFKEEGFLLIRNALTDNDLDAVVQEYEKHIDQRANELLDQGKLSRLYKDQPFERRLVCICKENNEIYPELDIMHLRGKASFDFLRIPLGWIAPVCQGDRVFFRYEAFHGWAYILLHMIHP